MAHSKTPLQNASIKHKLSQLKKHRIVRFAALYLAAFSLLVTLMCVRQIKSLNYLELFPNELIFALGVHAVSALLVSGVIFFFSRLQSFFAKFVATTILALYVGLYEDTLNQLAGPLKALVPGMSSEDSLIYASGVLFILLTILSVKLAGLLDRSIRKRSEHTAKDLQTSFYMLVLVVVAIPVFTVGSKLPLILRQSSAKPQSLGQPATTQNNAKPDIYYIVLDRYTNSDVLKNQFNYDNSDFLGTLKTKGYNVRNNAYSNYQNTTMSISSTLNAQYTNGVVSPFVKNKTQARTLYHNLIQQSEVVKALKAQGYSYHNLGSAYGVSYRAPLADTDHNYQAKLSFFGRERKLTGIEASEFRSSPYFRLATEIGAPWWPVKLTQRDHKEDVRNQLDTLDELASSREQGGRFIFAHILVPHDPYIFLADGSYSTNPNNDNEGMPIKTKYLNQVEFMNKQMTSLIDKIETNSSGQAVVILNADEGPYPQYLNGTFRKPAQGNVVKQDLTQWSPDWLQMKTGILQAVHIPRASEEDMKSLSSVNIFRIVLNNYAGYKLSYLPDCHFVTNESTDLLYRYRDVTGRVTGTDNPACRQYESRAQ